MDGCFRLSPDFEAIAFEDSNRDKHARTHRMDTGKLRRRQTMIIELSVGMASFGCHVQSR